MMDDNMLKAIRIRLWIAYGIALASLGLAVAALLRDPMADAGIRRSDARGGISVDDTTLGSKGLYVYGRGPSPSTARVTADHVGATVNLWSANAGLELFASGHQHYVALTARGPVTSELRVDTNTGAWSIIQNASTDGREVVIPLAPPMAK